MYGSVSHLFATSIIAGLVGAVAASCGPGGEGYVKVERTMTVTGYCPCSKCCDWGRTWYGMPVFLEGANKGEYKPVGITASGKRAKPGTIAADPAIPFGVKMRVPGYGVGTVWDRGGGIRGDHIDLFFKSHEAALRWGRKRLTVTMWLSEGHPMAKAGTPNE